MQKTRHLDIDAMSKALAILSSDAAHDLFAETFNVALLQKEDTHSGPLRAKTCGLFSAVAKENNSPRLAAPAYQIRIDAFMKVKEVFANMIEHPLAGESGREQAHGFFFL